MSIGRLKAGVAWSPWKTPHLHGGHIIACGEISQIQTNKEEQALKFSDEFVTYTLDWQRDRIQWLINDQVVRERVPKHWNTHEGCNAPFDRRFHLLLNLAVGGTFGGAPDARTRFPAEMEIDWVRVWQ